MVFGAVAVLIALSTYQTQEFERSARAPAMTETLALASRMASPTSTGELPVVTRVAPAGGPGYALVLAALSVVDEDLRDALSGHADPDRCTRTAFRSLIVWQYGLAIAALVLMFWIATTLSRSWLVALATVVLAFLAGTYGSHAGLLSPLPWVKALVLFALGALAIGVDRDDVPWTSLAGCTFGAASLFMPEILIVCVLTAGLLLVARLIAHNALQTPHWHALSFVGAAFLVPGLVWWLGPQPSSIIEIWGQMLHENWRARLQWSALPTGDQLAVVLAPIPILGAGLQALFGLPSIERLGLLAQNTDPNVGLIQYLVSTPGMALRGLWAGTPVVTLLGVIHLWPLLKYAKADQRFVPVVMVVGTVLLIGVVHALSGPNEPSHNVGLIFLLGFATAYVFGRSEVRRNFWPTRPPASNPT